MPNEVIWALVMIAGSSAVLWVGSNRVERASHCLAVRYNIPEMVKGSVITAVSSSIPELASAIIATLFHNAFELGISIIIGSAIFNILVIPAFSVLFGGNKMEVNPRLLFREMFFYKLSVLVLLVAFCLAVIYNPLTTEAAETTAAHTGSLTWPLALLPLGFYLFYLLLQYHETLEQAGSRSDDTYVNTLRAWAVLIGSVVVIALAVEFMIRAALELGAYFNTPAFFWGVTVLAVASSIPDLFISISAARNGDVDSSLSNAVGSNIFDLLVIIPVAVLLAGSVSFDFTHLLPLMAFLLAATLLIFVVFRHKMVFLRRHAMLFIGAYVLFVTWISLESFGLSHILGLAART